MVCLVDALNNYYRTPVDKLGLSSQFHFISLSRELKICNSENEIDKEIN